MTLMKPPQLTDKNPIIGDLKRAAADSVAFYELLLREFEDIAIYRYFMKEFYWINHPDYIKMVMTDPIFERSTTVRKFMGAFLGPGVFTSEGKTHLESRSLMLPAFHKKRIHALTEMFVAFTKEKVDTWQDGEQRNMSAEMMALALRVVSTALFGTDASDNAEDLKAGFERIQGTIDAIYPYYAAFAPSWMPVMRFGETRQAIDRFQEKTRSIIQDRRRTNEDRGDLLSMLLLAEDDEGRSMGTEEVVGQVASILFAGHETTANALTWIWYALARNPHVLEKLLHEMDTLLEGRDVTVEDLGALPYSRMVIDEALRLYPPAWYTERTPREDVMFGDYRVPAGSPVVITVVATHRDPRYFANPHDFIPERFAPENKDKIQKFTYLPFGSGTHRCLGDNFALIEMQMLLVTMLQRFTISVDEDFVPTPQAVVTMGIESGLPVTLHAR